MTNENTQQMTARTQSFAHQPSRSALAARSWSAAKRVPDAAARLQAMNRHFDQFPPVIVAAGR